MKFTLTHEFKCDVPTFWRLFFDKAFNDELFNRVLGFPAWEVLEQRQDDKEVVRRIKGTPKLNMPGPVAKLIGPNLSYIEEGRLDRATNTWRWKTIPSSMADKIRSEGSVKLEPAGEGRCRRVADIVMEAKVFGLGGLIESSAEKDLRNGWEKSAELTTKWLAEGRPISP